MDSSNLINFTNDSTCFKIASPLIPLPDDPQQKYIPRLSDVDNNPFDKVLRKTMRADPFDCGSEDSFKHGIISSSEDKENVHLISPYKTPMVKKNFRISNTPIYIGENETCNTPVLRKDFDRLILKDRRDSSEDPNNSSLQFLNDSVFNDTFNNGFVNSKELIENGSNNSLTIPEICLSDDNRSKKYSENIISFNSDSLNCSSISQIDSKTNFTDNSNLEISSKALFDKAFITEKTNFTNPENSNLEISSKAFITESLVSERSLDYRRRCMSASRPSKSVFSFKNMQVKRQLNNSFCGFQFDDRENMEKEFLKHDCVLLEEQKIKKKGDASFILQALDAEDMLDAGSPPWLEDNLKLPNDVIDDCYEKIKVDTQKCDENVQLPQKNQEDLEDSVKGNDINKNEIKINENDETAKNLLRDITDVLESDTNSVERKKLGESLLSSIALALNLTKSPTLNDKNDNKVSIEASVVEKKTKSLKPKNKMSCLKSLETKIKVQTTKISERNLKGKSDKEKNSKGPLKAVIPVKNMAKTKKAIVPKLTFGSSSCIAPKISTPNGIKPVAQSTPNIPKSFHSATTPTRSLSYLRSSLPRPSSTNDLNKSISPKNLGNTSGSCHNLGNTSGSYNLPDKPTHRFIPAPGNYSMLRRKSASDLKENNNLHKSFDVEKPAKPSKLKRSSSFQNKYFKA